LTARAKDGRRPAGRPLSNEDRQALRRAGAEDGRRSRTRQGLPERIEDPVTAAALAALLRDPAPGRAAHSPAKQAAPAGTSGIIPHARGGAGPVNRAEQRRQPLRDEIKREERLREKRLHEGRQTF
jgi:hypothetical protein